MATVARSLSGRREQSTELSRGETRSFGAGPPKKKKHFFFGSDVFFLMFLIFLGGGLRMSKMPSRKSLFGADVVFQYLLSLTLQSYYTYRERMGL